MQNSSRDRLDRKKFLIQIVIAIGISILFQLILDPLIYDPFIRTKMGVLESSNAIVICSLSMWWFSFSMAFFIYRENEIINNYLFCAFLALLMIVGIEFASLFFIDFLHIPPVIVVAIILWKYRSTLKLKNVALTSILLMIWFAIVRLIGTNYTNIPLFPWILLAIIFWPLLNILLVYIINRI